MKVLLEVFRAVLIQVPQFGAAERPRPLFSYLVQLVDFFVFQKSVFIALREASFLLPVRFIL